MAKQELFLPRAVALDSGGGVALQVVDFAYWETVTGPAAGGIATAMADPVEPGFYWRVERIVVTAAETTTIPECTVFAATPQPAPPALALRDFTRFGATQIAEYPTGLLVLPNTSLIVQWSGMDDGAIGTVSAQYQLVARVGGGS